MLQIVKKIIQKIEDYDLNLSQWLLAFSSIIGLRILIEHLLLGFTDRPAAFFIGSALAVYLFFLFSYLIVLAYLTIILKEKPVRVANVLLWGFFVVLLPPIIDRLICGPSNCWSFYAFDSIPGLIHRFFTFFGDNPEVGITYGVRVEVALAVLFVAIYAFYKVKNVLRALIAAFGVYVILFILGSFPSWIGYLAYIPFKKLYLVEGYDIASLFLSPISLFSVHDGDFLNALNLKMNLIYAFLLCFLLFFWFVFFWRTKSWIILKNLRLTQIILHSGLVTCGAALGAFYYPHNFGMDLFYFLAWSNLVLAAIFGWLASVFLNDIYDQEIDSVTNLSRPIPQKITTAQNYFDFFLVCFALSLVLALTVGAKFFFLILAYQLIGWIYSCWPFRLKRIPLVASLISALALVLLFLSGFILLADNRAITSFPAEIFWLLIVSFTLSLPLKDLKDIEGDRRDRVWTLPVILGEKWARFVIGLGVYLSYSLSIILLNAKILFFPAMLLGAVSFAVIQNNKTNLRRVQIWVFGILALYVASLAYFVFWPTVKFGL